MKLFSGAGFPLLVAAATTAGVLASRHAGVVAHSIPEPVTVCDTVIYQSEAYKLKRVGDFGRADIADSLLFDDAADTTGAAADTIVKLTARDTIKAPDSLRFTDPFRFKYYVALIDSLTHVIVRDSLKNSSDSLKLSAGELLKKG